ncbi:tetratricopeptide repeat-containing sensor histidine kinase [Formosa sp. PL04]|uniref:tetratricopeptide repeat-containing sensor histidine kinase n=1 Tax=Formosa sp. PL04 TaxID=3081755 RepID=UPI00298147E7|nr:tetratricopeptide repeat-containing sensor histidine kinase [Formosa sp. PL04]MDW5290467.1 tetratricopeptide repeat-containing sensor histidine kinase [Formosa sp. PL04]
MNKIILLIILLFVSSGYAQTKSIDSLTVELAFQKTDTSKISTSIKLVGELYEYKDYNLALKYIHEADKLASKLNYTTGLSQIAYLKALIYVKREDYINAINYFSDAKIIFKTLQDTLAIARINNQVGLIEISRGYYKQGLEHTLSAIQELEKRHLERELKETYSGLATAYLNNKKYDKAIEFNLKHLKLEELNGDTNTIIQINKNLASLYSIEKEHRKAIEYYERILMFKNENQDSIRSEILPKLGQEYLQFRDFEKADTYLSESLILNRNNNNTLGLIESLNASGELNQKQNKNRLAEKQLLEAFSLLKTNTNKANELKNYWLLKIVDSTQRNYQRAFMWQNKFHALKDSLQLVEKASALEKRNQIQSLENFDTIQEISKDNISLGSYSKMAMLGETKKKFDKLKIINYALLTAFVIVSTFLVLIYLNRDRRVKYTQELEAKNKKIELQNEAILEQSVHLEKINHAKDKLFSIVSHDLKDSLTSINGFIDLLKDGSLTRQEFDRLIPELSENANNASLLLFNLLNWSKSQMDALEPNASLFDIRDVVLDKIKLIEHKLIDKHIELIDNTLRDFVYADYSMVEIIIQNLLTNAVKFSKAGDSITISNHINNGNTIISIKDTGVGITKENLEKLFHCNSFTTIGTKNEKGTGLGLSICKELVDLNHGKIWVESIVNSGSTFYVELPKSKLARPELTLG